MPEELQKQESTHAQAKQMDGLYHTMKEHTLPLNEYYSHTVIADQTSEIFFYDSTVTATFWKKIYFTVLK